MTSDNAKMFKSASREIKKISRSMEVHQYLTGIGKYPGSPPKAQWRSVVHDFLQLNLAIGKAVTKFNCNSLLANDWSNAVTPANVIADCKTCGIYPFNRLAIKVPEDASILVKKKQCCMLVTLNLVQLLLMVLLKK